MIKTREPEDTIEDIGDDDFIRDVRELWIKYADPKYLDLLDTNPAIVRQDRVDEDLAITVPEMTRL